MGSSSKSSVRKSTPNPPTARFDDDEDLFPKAGSMKKTVSFAPDKKGAWRDRIFRARSQGSGGYTG